MDSSNITKDVDEIKKLMSKCRKDINCLKYEVKKLKLQAQQLKN